MNCRAAQRLLSAERDRTLGNPERADLEAHLAECSGCRHARLVVAAAVDSWRSSTAQVIAPDPDRVWQDIRREIRTAAPAEKRRLPAFARWTLPLTAAAALVFGATTAPRWFGHSTPAPSQEIARADFVETPKDS